MQERGDDALFVQAVPGRERQRIDAAELMIRCVGD
jgi:hypothetical protein